MDFGKIADGVYLMNNVSIVLVESQQKLSALAGAQPGTVAMTAGGEHMWQLDTDGTTWKPWKPLDLS